MPMPQMPKEFSFKYVMWVLWCNAVTVLVTIQGVLAAITLDPTLMSHVIFHWVSIGNALLVIVLAQIERRGPKVEDQDSAPLVQQPEMKK